MTVFYSMPKLLKLSSGNIDKILSMIKENKIKGDSYILNLDRLLDSRAEKSHKVEYIFLASFRNYADYILLGIDYLDITYIPDIDVRKIRGNTLISLENNKIIFKKEK